MRDVELKGCANLLEIEPSCHAYVTDAMIATRQVRYGARPSYDNRRFLEDKICEAMTGGRVIEMMTIWGGSKGYGLTSVHHCDLLDLMALKRLACLQEHVKEHHSPGIRMTIIWEDYTEKELINYTSTEYYDSFIRLIDVLGMGDYVRVVKESDLLPDADLIARNAEGIRDGRLAEVGWQGEVQWDFYLQRSKAEDVGLKEGEKRGKVAKYLGIALARYQQQRMPKHDVKLSFCPYPDTVPDAMRKGRLEYKVKPSKNSHKTAGPWSAYGVLRSEDDWTYVTVGEWREGKYEESSVSVNGMSLPVLLNRRI